jgi:hypothetical protein
MALRAPIGSSDFRQLRERGASSVDRSLLEVRSNRESGLGRCDVLILPRVPNRPGAAIELKALGEGEPPERAPDSALRQIRDHAAERRARGAAPPRELAIVLDGKRAHVRAA